MNFFKARSAVSALFFVNGFLIGNWAPKIPEFAARLSLDESQMGLMIAVFGIGALISMPITGVIIARWGTAVATKTTSLIAATTLFWVTLAPSTYSATAAVFVFGAFIAGMDVAMNAVAVEIEKKRASPIMSSCHGFWSLGGLVGALAGGYLIQNFGTMAQASAATLICLTLVWAAWIQISSRKPAGAHEQHPIRLPVTLLPYLIGFAALFSAMPEGAVIDWSALYMRQELGSDAFISSVAFGGFSATMAIVRFFGDPIRKRLGAVKTVKICAVVAAIGFIISGVSTSPFLVILGFAIVGLGLSNLVPIAFSAAGNLPGLAPGIALSLTTTIGYSGILVAPAIFGYIAKITGFAVLFSSLALFLLAVFALAPILRFADFKKSQLE